MMSSCMLIFFFICSHCQVSAITFQQSPPQIVEESTEVQIKCSHNDTSLLTMLWYQQRQDTMSMTLIGYGYGTSPPNYEGQFEEQFKLTREDTVKGALIVLKANPSTSAVYFCAASTHENTVTYNDPAYFGQGTKLTVLGKYFKPGINITAPTVQVLPPSPKEWENKDRNDNTKKNKTIVCVATGFYPDHVSVDWKIDRKNVTDGVATDSAALRKNESYIITSRLRVPFKYWFTLNKEFTCTVSFFNGTHNELYSDSVYGVEAKGVLTREKYLKITQNAKLSYAVLIFKSSIYGAFVVFLVWKLQSSAGKQKD
ncbi:T cell receptor beta chain MC.7.G5-like [Cebidichthys violaceus]|uniref:T cell receptor beta chain MC.7.G5-like n=1 Tax=Cebidichthys violaceus TaxID=271503 RepID=UPI0035CBBEDC